MTRLLILSSDTGKDTTARRPRLKAQPDLPDLMPGFESLSKNPPLINRSLANFYNVLLAKGPQWMGWYFRLIDRLRPNERDFCYTRSREFIGRYLESENPEYILSVHPMLNHFIPRFVKEEGLGHSCFSFLTDPFPPFWRGWASPYVDQYFVPTDEALQALTASGVPAWRIERVSMPVRPQFVPATMSANSESARHAQAWRWKSHPHQRRRSRRRTHLSNLQIDPQGGARCKRSGRSAEETARCDGESNACGIRRRALSVFWKIFIDTFQLPISSSPSQARFRHMRLLACRVPVLLTALRCLMPQESGLFAAAHHFDFGFGARTFGELESVIGRGPAEWNRKRESIPQFYTPHSADEWIERILPLNVRA